jgi:regulatory protein YycI of two-component signal transduction system YycFG
LVVMLIGGVLLLVLYVQYMFKQTQDQKYKKLKKDLVKNMGKDSLRVDLSDSDLDSSDINLEKLGSKTGEGKKQEDQMVTIEPKKKGM